MAAEGKKRQRQNRRGEQGGHSRGRVCVRIHGDGTRRAYTRGRKRVEKKNGGADRAGDGGLVVARAGSVGRSAPSVWPQHRPQACAIHLDRASLSRIARSCSGRNGKSHPSPPFPSRNAFYGRLARPSAPPTRPLARPDLTESPDFSVFSKEHDHSSFYKFLQMEHNHKNLDCYFFYYSTCKKVRTGGFAPRGSIPRPPPPVPRPGPISRLA